MRFMEGMMTILPVRSLTVSVWLHTTVDPTQEEWARSVAQLRSMKAELKDDLSQVRSIVVSDGGAPSARQRTELFSEVFEGAVPGVVITNSLNNPLKRGIATALSWLNPRFRAVGPGQSREAFQHIGCDQIVDRDKIWNELVKMQAQLPAVRTLQEMASHLGLEPPVRRSSAQSAAP